MIITSDLKVHLKNELINATEVWIASAMISRDGWQFLKKNININAKQNYLIGIDLPTNPCVFEDLMNDDEISAKIFETIHTFHPKVYLIKKADNKFCAFIGSSNTTTGGLEKNTEMNVFITNQVECNDLLSWFNSLYIKGKKITNDFLKDYKIKYKNAYSRIFDNKKDVINLKDNLNQNKNQFFSYMHHSVFEERYWRLDNDELLSIRTDVRDKFIQLHKIIYPQFNTLGIKNLYSHYHPQDIISKHYPNRFSGLTINAMWLQYGKSKSELSHYPEGERNFIKHIRLQIIIQHESVGIWLVLGKNDGSRLDRNNFRSEMNNGKYREKIFRLLKLLDNSYWLECVRDSYHYIKDIRDEKMLHQITNEESFDQYFIIGKDIDYNSNLLSDQNIANTVINEFLKLYPLYELMKHQYSNP